MKFNLIYRLKKNEIGSGITTIYLANTYPNLFCSYNEHENIFQLKNRIWRLQNPYFYKTPFIDRKDDFVMVRKQFLKCVLGKKIVDGYSYYKNNISNYQAWFPTIYQSSFQRNEIPSIGYYIRDIRSESNFAFIDFLSSIPNGVPIVTMGTKEIIQDQLSNRLNWIHTYKNNDFWKKCSHYFYYQCSDFEDPFPSTLLEAIQSQHRIISLKDINRRHVDGIDDFLSCIEYDDHFIDTKVGKYCKELDSITWRPYIEELVNTKFNRNHIIYKSNSLLCDWIWKFLR